MSVLATRPRGRPPASKAADTRDRILRAAREVFSELGYDAATFQAISARADLTRPAINHYFASKQHLYREVVAQTNAKVIATSARTSEREVTLSGRMRVYVETALQAQAEDPSSAAFLVTSVLESQRRPELRQADNDSLQFSREFVDSAVRDAIAHGDLRADLDVDATVEMLVAMLWGLGFHTSFVGSQERLAVICEQFLRLLDSNPWRRSG